MFKKKKTYIDKINFDVFEDEPSDFDLFSKEKYYEDNDDYDEENSDVEDDYETDEDVKEGNIVNEEDVKDDDVNPDVDKKDKNIAAIVDKKVEETKDEDIVVDEHKKDGNIEIDENKKGDENIYTDEEENDDIEIDVEDIEDVAPEDMSDEDTSFSYDDFDKIVSEEEVSDKKSKVKKKKSKGKVFALVFLWILIFGAGVMAFLYFQTDVFKKKNKDTATSTDAATTTTEAAAEVTSEEYDENFYTIYSYETNADVNINALMADYYDALVKGDREKLKDIVTEPEAFGDMMIYETKAQVISEYSNITCYTIPGLNENEILVFTTSNVTITGVNSKPLDIKQFYVVKEGNNYKINNGVLPQEVIDYINVQAGSPDVQNLYKSVQDNINQCLAEDSTFAEFYNKINSEIEDSEE